MNNELREKVLQQLRITLKNRREDAGHSMNRLSEMSGLSQQTISYIERGKRQPSVDSFLRICEALEVDASELLLEAEVKSTLDA